MAAHQLTVTQSFLTTEHIMSLSRLNLPNKKLRLILIF